MRYSAVLGHGSDSHIPQRTTRAAQRGLRLATAEVASPGPRKFAARRARTIATGARLVTLRESGIGGAGSCASEWLPRRAESALRPTQRNSAVVRFPPAQVALGRHLDSMLGSVGRALLWTRRGNRGLVVRSETFLALQPSYDLAARAPDLGGVPAPSRQRHQLR